MLVSREFSLRSAKIQSELLGMFLDIGSIEINEEAGDSRHQT
jgi:hypothetical protein